jgi:hypothetical protein
MAPPIAPFAVEFTSSACAVDGTAAATAVKRAKDAAWVNVGRRLVVRGLVVMGGFRVERDSERESCMVRQPITAFTGASRLANRS